MGFHGARRHPNKQERDLNHEIAPRITESEQYKKALAAFRAEVPIMIKRIDATEL